jgi:hypothetical protein
MLTVVALAAAIVNVDEAPSAMDSGLAPTVTVGVAGGGVFEPPPPQPVKNAGSETISRRVNARTKAKYEELQMNEK